jgi:hypothetical protein
MLKRIRRQRKKKQELKRERIAALMACILRNKTNEQSWLAKDIEHEYVSAFLCIMKGDWEKALNLVAQIKHTPPDVINCRCSIIALEDSPPENKYMEVDITGEDPDNIVGNFLVRKAHREI